VVEFAELERETVQYSWSDSDHYIFMSKTTFEEVKVPRAEIENGQFLLEGSEVRQIDRYLQTANTQVNLNNS
jgi:translation elongation factor P/translation initiation factor 5A